MFIIGEHNALDMQRTQTEITDISNLRSRYIDYDTGWKDEKVLKIRAHNEVEKMKWEERFKKKKVNIRDIDQLTMIVTGPDKEIKLIKGEINSATGIDIVNSKRYLKMKDLRKEN